MIFTKKYYIIYLENEKKGYLARDNKVKRMNTFLQGLQADTNFTRTENGALTHKTTGSRVFDMFAMGGAYRSRSEADCILLFKNAIEEDITLAMKCLFYIRDIRGGQGERRFFRVCFKWLCKEYPEVAKRNIKYMSEYGRYDDMLYATEGTSLEEYTFSLLKEQLVLDLECKTPSLLGKWLPSENASAHTTKKMANKFRKYLKMTHKQYRKVLSTLRARINIVERLMSANEWDKIEFDKIPSKAGLIYKNAFARRDIIAKKYETFIKSDETKVNAKTLYPYDVAHDAFHCYNPDFDCTERTAIQKYWDALPNYYGDNKENGLAMVDVSGSMSGRPMEAAVSLGAYIAEKAHGPFANHFITFSGSPELVKFEGVDITDKFHRAQAADWGMNTNLKAAFDMLLNVAKKENTKAEDMPERLYIFSDMEFDDCLVFSEKRNRDRWGYFGSSTVNSVEEAETLLEGIAREWADAGYNLPSVVFWNLDARQNNIPMLDGRFSYVSGLSPVMIEQILSGKDGYDLMLAKLNSERYEVIK